MPLVTVPCALDENGEEHRIIPGEQGFPAAACDAARIPQAVRQFADGTRDAKLAGKRAHEEFERSYKREIAVEKYRRLLEAVAG